MALEHGGNAASPDGVRGMTEDRPAGKRDHAALRPQGPRHGENQGRLARPIASDQRGHFRRPHRQRDTAEYRLFAARHDEVSNLNAAGGAQDRAPR